MKCPNCVVEGPLGAERCAACGFDFSSGATAVALEHDGSTRVEAGGETHILPSGDTPRESSGGTRVLPNSDTPREAASDTKLLAPSDAATGDTRLEVDGETQVETAGVTPPGPARTLVGTRPLLASRYQVQELLGAGGMGSVFKAHDQVLGEIVALKLLKPDLLADATIRERFKAEIRTARKVRHPNVCSIYEFGEAEHGPYISMELIVGSDLKHVIKQRGGLPSRQAFELAIQVAEGLQAVHDAGIVHRDLKSANLMLDATGRVRLMDFGIAKREGDRAITTGQVIVGTPDYMSPEQAQGLRVGPRSDIYALGVVIFEMFTGRLPFSAPSPLGVALKHVHDEPPLGNPLIPPGVREVLARALAKDPSARYATARAVANALRSAQTEAAAPSAAALGGRTSRPPARRPWLFALAVAILAAAGAAMWGMREQEPGPVSNPTAGTRATGETPGSALTKSDQRALLLVVVRPWGELSIDGKLVGTTPLDWVPVSAGPHLLRLRHPSLGAWEQSVTLEAGERRRIVVELPGRAAPRRN